MSAGEGAPGTLQIISPVSQETAAAKVLAANSGIAAVMPAQNATDGSNLALIQAVPKVGPSSNALKTTIDELRAELPAQAKVGGAAVENLDLQSALDAKTALVLGIILAMGFLLLLIALQAPLLALLGALTNLLATGAALSESAADPDVSWDAVWPVVGRLTQAPGSLPRGAACAARRGTRGPPRCGHRRPGCPHRAPDSRT